MPTRGAWQGRAKVVGDVRLQCLPERLDPAIGNRTEGPTFLSPVGKAWTVPSIHRKSSWLRDLVCLAKIRLRVARSRWKGEAEYAFPRTPQSG
jgi:hypothetical protein